jgi:hypothetical protein
MSYRMMSAVAHHHNWALLQLGFRQSAVRLPGEQSNGRLVEKSAGSVHSYAFLAIRAAKSLTFPLWRKCLYYGWERDRLVAVLEALYDDMGAKDGVRFWR